MTVIFVLVSIFSSVIGAICGIGGGFIIKPVMDAFNVYSSATVSIMSCIIVLCMTSYSLLSAAATKTLQIDKKTTPPLGLGAAIGGVFGKIIFDIISEASGNKSLIGLVQALVFLAVTILTLIYNINKSKVKTRRSEGVLLCFFMGLLLGIISSFLGIGGGPINLVVLHYFFSQPTKIAVKNSLFMVFLSQLASLLYTIISGRFPEIPVLLLIIMSAGGVLGGIIGRFINKKIDDAVVDKLFTALMVLIIAICIYNAAINAMAM